MSREITEQKKEEYRKCDDYKKKREELMQKKEEACSRNNQREWFEKTLVEWLNQRELIGRYSRAEVNQAYIDSLQEGILSEVKDEDYVEMLLKTSEFTNIPAYVVVFTRDVLCRRLQLDRNAACVKKMLDWCTTQICNGQVVRLPKGEHNPETGIQFFAESMVLTGEVKENDTITEAEQSILQIAGAELTGRCIQSGMLVKEKAEAYIDYAMSCGHRSGLPVLIALKHKEKQ